MFINTKTVDFYYRNNFFLCCCFASNEESVIHDVHVMILSL